MVEKIGEFIEISETTDSTPQSEVHHATVDRYVVRGSGAEIILDNGQTILMSKYNGLRPLMTPGAYITYHVDDNDKVMQRTIEIISKESDSDE